MSKKKKRKKRKINSKTIIKIKILINKKLNKQHKKVSFINVHNLHNNKNKGTQ
jgi:hypothetical protein